ncbi:MAG: UDP-N-acetylglucosamine 1-carboxyvinyltransferase [Spirochaetota bacterium]|nr:UDP-N-acetylglucosamine 1-carboxyvinyltransferase [Spirochaetota bacterium]
MGQFIVDGGYPLSGTITPQGNKNEALPILAAVTLTHKEVIIKNLPKILDVINMIKILESIGVKVKQLGDHEYSFQADEISLIGLDVNLAKSLRGSFTLVGPLLTRFKTLEFPKPGGDKIGRRRIDTHLLALKALGVQVEITDDGYYFSHRNELKSNDILLDEASVTATENVIMMSVFARGKIIIRNAASEPHVQQLCHFINSIGGKISGIGSNILTVEGVYELSGGEHSIGADYLEVGSFISLAAVTNSEITIKDAGIEHLRMILNVFERLGIHTIKQGKDLLIPKNQSLKIVSDYHGAITKIDDAPWPGLPADMTSIALVTATQCIGTVLIFEKMFESRLFFVDKLINMGARIVLCDPHRAVVIGPSQLVSDELTSPDIRAGVALLIAALCAKGRSVIHNIVQIDRGYEDIDSRLQSLGARIERAAD